LLERQRALAALKCSKLFRRDVVIPLVNELNLDFSYYGIQYNSSQCGTHKRFDPAKSLTFIPLQRNFTLDYGTGTVISGYVGQDTVILGLSRQIGQVATDKSFMNLGGIDVNAYIGNIVDGISIGGVNSSALNDT
ncbi:11900_t:CDS:2, partial [Racocetra persica]